ncbi:MAG TPA: hypothetical protein VM261_26995 [Kofleriaceae bacterium]|nr:hypothetical protein [Kofleriaceae bacterium]
MGWFSRLLSDGDEAGWDDLRGLTVEALADLAHHGARGEVIFPADVAIRVAVPARSVAVARGFVEDPRFDREVGAALANRCDVAVGALPRRAYDVIEGERVQVSVAEQAPRTWALAVVGGDLDGRRLPLPVGGGDLTFGRGGAAGDARGQIDLAVCTQTAFVSRRAGTIHRLGHALEISALDQGDLLLVRRASGEVVRPARTARGRVAVREGDTIELSDGKDGAVRLAVERTGQE